MLIRYLFHSWSLCSLFQGRRSLTVFVSNKITMSRDYKKFEICEKKTVERTKQRILSSPIEKSIVIFGTYR